MPEPSHFAHYENPSFLSRTNCLLALRPKHETWSTSSALYDSTNNLQVLCVGPLARLCPGRLVLHSFIRQKQQSWYPSWCFLSICIFLQNSLSFLLFFVLSFTPSFPYSNFLRLSLRNIHPPFVQPPYVALSALHILSSVGGLSPPQTFSIYQIISIRLQDVAIRGLIDHLTSSQSVTMADTEEPQFSTLAERIAALNQQKNFKSNAEPIRKRPPPPPPPGRLAIESRTQSLPVPIVSDASASPPGQTSPSLPPRPKRNNVPPPPADQNSPKVNGTHHHSTGAPPPLPSRAASSQTLPVLPPRRSTTQSTLMVRRNSGSSEISQHSTMSSMSVGHTASSVTSQGSEGTIYKLPPAFDPANLPKLPPTKREREAKHAEEVAQQAEAAKRATQAKTRLAAGRPVPLPPTRQIEAAAATPKPTLPPRLPSRPAKPQQNATAPAAAEPALPPRRVPPRLTAGTVKPWYSNGLSKPQDQQEQPPQLPGSRPTIPTRPTSSDEPPPVPLTSRPTFAQIDAASSRAVAPTQSASRVVKCWVCHDWSGPDGVAAQFPRQSLPRNDPVGHLARGLCDPFPSYTDKARAIFTWAHYNIRYDTVAFFGKTVKHMGVEETILNGLAVCQGYAEAYKAIANRAGLECVLVSGHGKGFGHTPLKPGERPPPAKIDGHAWNAVRIDGGEWRLIDACWGAGHVDPATKQYTQKFNPDHFTSSNEKFGLRHLPKDPQYQFRSDGKVMGWDEYYIGPTTWEEPTFYNKVGEEGISKESVQPKEKNIPVNSGEVVRFQFSKICEHWTSEKFGLGKPPLLLLCINGVDGRKEEMIPMETNGYWHWIDVNARDLGAPGQNVQVAMVTSMDGQDARGATAQEYLSKRGNVNMSWGYVMRWELV